jgi:dolichol-phosphate mannosyltransferase
MSIKFSVVSPVYNESENLRELYDRLTPVLENLCDEEGFPPLSYEIILVDDGSTDNSWQIIKTLHEKDSRVKGISFSKNFGHHIAITAGLDHARGDAVILLDADLQDPPEEMPKLLREFKKGNDLVYGIRQQRQDSVLKKLTSYLFWWILRRFSGVNIPQGQTMLRIMSRRLVEVLKEMREHARFIHGMIAWAGFTVSTVEVQHSPRMRGKSKYNIPKMFKLAFHAVTSFSTVPLRLATYLGFLSAFTSMLVGGYFIYRKIFYNIPVLGYASIIVSIFLSEVSAPCFRNIREYLGRTYQEVQKRPLYISKEVI